MLGQHSSIKAKYKLGVVDMVHPSDDGLVRSVTLRYANVQSTPDGNCKVSIVHVKRSVQRLVLVLPVEEQSKPVVVEDHGVKVVCKHFAKAGV